MRVARVLLGLTILVACFGTTPVLAYTPAQTNQATTEAKVEPKSGVNKLAYSLAPEKLARAIEYSRKRVAIEFVDEGWGILQLILLLTLGVAAWMRDVAVKMSAKRWAQAYTFLFLFLAISTLL